MTVIAGVYPAAPQANPWNAADEETFLRAVLEHEGVDGLELPFAGALHAHDEDWLLKQLPREGTHLVTAVPGTAGRSRQEPRFGLASADPAGRAEAVRMINDVRAAVDRVNQSAGREAVLAVEIQSAPGRADDRTAGTLEALTESLREIAAWDWSGAALVIEHCDAARDDHPAEKGFLDLEDEIVAIRRSGVDIGLSLNWARSVIEGRDPATAIEHVRATIEAGLLRGVIFSGVTASGDTPWIDGHLAPRPGDPESLLGAEEIRETLRAVGDHPLSFIGAKVVARPTDLTPQDRAEGVCAAVDLVRDSLSAPDEGTRMTNR